MSDGVPIRKGSDEAEAVYMIIYEDTVINAMSSLQKGIALSDIEAKFVALSESCRVIIW